MVSGNYFVLSKVNGRREFFVSYNRWVCQCLLWCVFSALTKALCLWAQFKLPGFTHLASLVLVL